MRDSKSYSTVVYHSTSEAQVLQLHSCAIVDLNRSTLWG